MDPHNTSESIILGRLLSHTQDGFFVLDKDRRVVLFNAACERLTGYSAVEVVGKESRCPDLLNCHDEHGRLLPERMCPALAVLNGEEPSTRQRIRITTKSGENQWIENIYTAINSGEGRPEYVLGVMRDINEYKAKEEQWRQATENLRQEVEHLRDHLRERYGFASIISRSARMQLVLEKIKSACNNSSSVLISGESGSGKEMIARTIHFNGLQKNGPFVPVTVTAFANNPERLEGELFGYARGSLAGASRDYDGLFSAADGGTLYLANIDAMSLGTQDKLLRAIQDRSIRSLGKTTPTPVNVRVIVATSRPIQELLSRGKIREELYYRLSVIAIEVPPLRLRKEDIPFLVEHFIGQFNQHSTRQVNEVHPAVWAALDEHDWPGNVRELQSVIESTFAAGDLPCLMLEELSISKGGEDYPERIESYGGRDTIPLDDMLAEIERKAILDTLRKTRGQRSLAAKLMGISRSRLYRRMDALGISPREQQY
ncbi:MAG: sigma 54-interacting transcriptional regulator [Planctomycetota bacterium]|nr:MAG: sigma 54-interacting transcriptional regulator [Planctomycetota bacterium]